MKPKILITGPARTGTTFLVYLFHNLGFDTGYSQAEMDKYFNEKTNGLEWMSDVKYIPKFKSNIKQEKDTSPQVIKEPFRFKGKGVLTALDWSKKYNWPMSHVFICFRNFKDAQESSIQLFERKKKISSYHNWKYRKYTPEIWNAKYREKCEVGSFSLFRQLASTDTPFSLLWYPRHRNEVEYCYNKLKSVLDINIEEFTPIWERSVDEAR